MKTLIIRKNSQKIGLDVGWRVTSQGGLDRVYWWGNTRDDASLQSLIADLRAKGGVFEVEDLREKGGKS